VLGEVLAFVQDCEDRKVCLLLVSGWLDSHNLTPGVIIAQYILLPCGGNIAP
jgi:hypothetical protein